MTPFAVVAGGRFGGEEIVERPSWLWRTSLGSSWPIRTNQTALQRPGRPPSSNSGPSTAADTPGLAATAAALTLRASGRRLSRHGAVLLEAVNVFPSPALAGEGGATGRRKTPVFRRAMALDEGRGVSHALTPTLSRKSGRGGFRRQPAIRTDRPVICVCSSFVLRRPNGSTGGQRRSAASQRPGAGMARPAHGPARRGHHGSDRPPLWTRGIPAPSGASLLVPVVRRRHGHGLAFLRHHHLASSAR